MSGNKHVAVAAGILIDADKKFLLGNRPAGKPYAGYWEFPGGKLEAGETPLDALKRELIEEMGVIVTDATPWIVQSFDYPHATVRLHFFRITQWQGEPKPYEGQEFAWQWPGSLSVSPILPANGPILRGLMLPDELALSNVAGLSQEIWLQRLQNRLDNGLKWLVLREPQYDAQAYRALVDKVLTLCRAAGCRLIIHGDIALAQEINADGVQLPVRIAAQLSERPRGIDWLGISAHNAAELAQAQRIGADYVLLGHVMPTASHPGQPPLGWEKFAQLVGPGWPFPIYAIGGMHAEEITTVQQYGGHGVALLSAAWI